MNDQDLKKIGDEFERFLTPVSEQLDRIEKTQTEHTDKIDALMADVIHLQAESGAIKDKITLIDEKLTKHVEEEREELNEIRDHVNLPPVIQSH